MAVVGKQLSGTSTKKRRRQGRTVEVTDHLYDGATVLAIYAPDPYLVVTNGRPLGQLVSAWANPLMAGVPRLVRHFP